MGFLSLALCQEVSEAEITFSGSSTTSCPVLSCSQSEWFPNRACNTDGASVWEDGSRTFDDPVPAGHIVRSVTVVYYLNAGCSTIEQGTGRVTLDGGMVGFTPELTPAGDCSCKSCMTTMTLSATADEPTGWPNYHYGEKNTVKLWFDPPVCVTKAVISLEYTEPTPTVIFYRPVGIPLNTESVVDIYGEHLVNSEGLSCSFSGNLINATYHNETHVSCKVPSYGSAVSTRLQLIESTNEIIEVGPFTWYESPSIENVEPQEGTTPINVTLTGNGFINTTALQCRFGNIPVLDVQYVSNTTVICLNVRNPTKVVQSVNVSFTENGENFVDTGFTFSFINNTQTTATEDKKKAKPFIIVAVLVAVMLVIILLTGGIIIVFQSRTKDGFGDEKYFTAADRFERFSSIQGGGPMDSAIPKEQIRNLRQIEKGSFGIIYEATWRGTKIAVKKLPTTMTDKQLAEFYDEAALMKTLRHPNILQYLGISQSGREVCICMEFMPLGSLYHLLHLPSSSYSRHRAKSICLDTVRGMNYLHQQQPPIIHRDLKSHNLLVDRHWQVKVCDFGLSRITAQNQTMTACGTPSWTAPEVLRNERYTTKADVYGFGVVVWELFSRSDPFPGMPPFQIVFAVGTQNLRPALGVDWPRPWVDLITRCWNEDPNARPTFEQLITIIENLEDPV